MSDPCPGLWRRPESPLSRAARIGTGAISPPEVNVRPLELVLEVLDEIVESPEASAALIEALDAVPREEHERGVCWHGTHAHGCQRERDEAVARAERAEAALREIVYDSPPDVWRMRYIAYAALDGEGGDAS